MTARTVAEKARVKPGTRIALLNAVQPVVDALGLPADTAFVEPASAQLVFLFVRSRSDLESRMPTAVATLPPGATLWVFFQKGSRTAGLDMNRNDIWTIAEPGGLRPLGLVSVDDRWSAFRLRSPE